MTGYVEVALPLPVDQTFTYAVPEGESPPPGTRVLVPFRRTERIGWVVGPTDRGDLRRVRKILDVLDDEPSVPGPLLRLARWISEYYLSPPGMTLRAAVPSALADHQRDNVVLAGEPRNDLTPREERVVEALRAGDGPRRVRGLRKELGMGSIWPEIRSLKTRGLLRHEVVPPSDRAVKTRRVVRIRRWLSSLAEREELFSRAPRQRECYEVLEAAGGAAELAHLTGSAGFSYSVVSGLEAKGVVVSGDEEVVRDPFSDVPAAEPEDLTPTREQRAAIGALVAALDEESPRPFLLHGVTGSGKTLVYIELLREVVNERGRSAIVLVPEIALTPQTVSRFRAHFGDTVAVLHSGLSRGERYDAWRQLRAGERRIAVGARSAIFSPLPDVGAIVVDEEHEGSYKQSETPRYHARDVAVVRAALAGAVCVLGSATPSLESWVNVRREKYRLLTLSERVGGGRLPPVRVVDLRTGDGGEEGSGEAFRTRVVSPELEAAVDERLERGEQAILLLNRRGYSTYVQCRECGDVETCADCAVSLTFHRARGRVVCHHCGYEEPAPERCGQCGSPDLSFRGLGTEQVERIVAETFPGARIARMDVDTTSGKWAHQEILGRVERREVDILLGTQMIAKGLDFPNVTLVGVVNADVGIHLPDFRASERTFQLLSQVAGRAGRGPRGGEVILQTALPDHYAIRAALDHDYTGFVERELRERESPKYPPHVRMANVVVSDPDQESAASAAEAGARWVRRWIGRDRRRGSALAVTGPAPCPIERLHGRWRWHFFLRAGGPGALGRALREFGDGYEPRGSSEVRVVVDRDPVSLL